MKVAFRFRLYPDRKQKQRMCDAVEACRRLWNLALLDRKEAWEYKRLSTTYGDQCSMLTVEAKSDEQFGALYSQVGQEVLHRLDKAFRAFFEHRAGYPKLKKYRESGSFTYPQAYNGSVKPDALRKRLYLSKIGNVRTVFHRDLPKGALKACTVKREPDGKWYACLVYDDGMAAPLQAPGPLKAPVGIDRGLIALVATSDGEKVEAPRFLRKAEAKLKRLQRGLSKKRKGSKNRERARHKLARQHARVANQRKDLSHKLSNILVKKHDLIAFEVLRVSSMVKNHALAKSISDAGWGKLVAMAEYKAERHGKLVVKVQAAYTTQECFFCGTLNPMSLYVWEFECGGCGRTLDRDVNAGRVVLKRAIAQVGRDRTPGASRPGGEAHRRVVPELKPVETGPPPSETTRRASLAVEAGTTRGGSHAAQQGPTAGSPRMNSWEGVTRCAFLGTPGTAASAGRSSARCPAALPATGRATPTSSVSRTAPGTCRWGTSWPGR